MANVLLLYGKPVDADTGWPALSVTGTLPGYRSGDSFEGRLQINNPIGKCTVERLSGELPPGAAVYVDNFNHEVVIAWPEYAVAVEEAPTPVPNASFEQGDVLWKKGAGWTIQNFGVGTYAVTDGAWSAVFSNASGTGDLIGLPVPIATSEPITLSCDIQQGGSSSGNVAARVALVWFNGTVQIPEASLGNIISEGSGGAFATSTVTATKPEGATHVAAGATATRKRQNKPLFVDNFQWNLSYPTGTTLDYDYSICLRVTDSAGRTADWCGVISEHYVYLTSLPYPALSDADGMTVAPFFVSASSKLAYISHDQPHEDSLTVAPFFVSALTKNLNWAHTQPPEDFLTVAPFFVAASSKQVYFVHTQPQEDNLTVAPIFVSASSKQVLITNTIPFESLTVSPFFVSASTT